MKNIQIYTLRDNEIAIPFLNQEQIALKKSKQKFLKVVSMTVESKILMNR